MKCQNCKKNEADQIFFVSWMGVQYQMALCTDCLEEMWNRANSAGQAEAFSQYTGWWPGKPEPRDYGELVFPEEADPKLRKEREIAALSLKLEEAAERENYEEAARLRDSIARIRREVCPSEN
ncbi:MAG: UvrB/UvrC motif-containing protein [Clostridiales bacterium]|nr:UvrB/UvrC motif-containing protein [Clostridiales bacterium]